MRRAWKKYVYIKCNFHFLSFFRNLSRLYSDTLWKSINWIDVNNVIFTSICQHRNIKKWNEIWAWNFSIPILKILQLGLYNLKIENTYLNCRVCWLGNKNAETYGKAFHFSTECNELNCSWLLKFYFKMSIYSKWLISNLFSSETSLHSFSEIRLLIKCQLSIGTLFLWSSLLLKVWILSKTKQKKLFLGDEELQCIRTSCWHLDIWNNVLPL
jgi:hypothetical protein